MSTVIKGKQREEKSFAKQVGIFEANVIAINPTMDELNEIYNGNANRDEEPVYHGEKEVTIDDEGTTQMVPAARINVVFKDIKTEAILNAQIYLEDRPRVNKDKTRKQYINTKGTTAWGADEESLPSWFLRGGEENRVAKVGEEELYNFFMKWCGFDYKDPELEVVLDWEAYMKGDFSQLKAYVKTNATRSLVGMATIKVKEEDGEEKVTQSVYTKQFLPGYTMKVIRTMKITPEYVQSLLEQVAAKKAGDTSVKALKPVDKFIAAIADPENGEKKNFYKFAPLQDYNPEENLVESSAVHEEDDPNY